MEILEGKQCVLPAIYARQRKIHLVMIKHGTHVHRINDVLAAAERFGIAVKFSSKEEIDRLAHGKTHGGIIALASYKPALPVDNLFSLLEHASSAPFLLLLEGVEDSKNLGFTIRSAEAFGVHGILLKKHIWDFDMTAVSRSSSGAYERIPLVKLEQAGKILLKVHHKGIVIWGCIAGAKRTVYDADFTEATLLCVGGEKRGLSAAVRERCDKFIRIPMAQNATSLSMSHAATVLMAEVMRQRREQRILASGREND